MSPSFLSKKKTQSIDFSPSSVDFGPKFSAVGTLDGVHLQFFFFLE